MTSSDAADTSTPARLTSASWWFRDSDGRLAVAQLPNPAIWVWLVAVVAGLSDLSDDHADLVAGIRKGALLVWSLDELARGASPFRRVLGAVVLAAQLVSLAASWS